MRKLLSLTLTGALACLLAPEASRAVDEPVNLNQSLVLTDTQRKTFEDEAAKGSGEAALKLAQFYGFVLLNPVEDQRWTQIGAENGSAACQYNLYHVLAESDSDFDRRRALFWLRKAAAVDASAKKELDEIEHRKGAGP